MGSRIMHLIIANRIVENLAIKDKAPFLLGGLAPDAVSDKDSSHFFTGEIQDYSRSVDYKAFLRKYETQAENPYLLGYYTHLIADDMWFRGFYLPWLKNRMDANREMLNMYHNDFRLLNGKLVEHYGYRDELSSVIQSSHAIVDLDEVKAKEIYEFIPYVLGDLEYTKDFVMNEKLSVFTFDQIIGYIETSVDIGMLNINTFIKNAR